MKAVLPRSLAFLVAVPRDGARLLRDVERGDGVLAHSLLIGLRQFGIALAHDRAHAHLRQFLRHGFPVEQAALRGRLVLDEGRDHLVDVLAANSRGFRALRRRQPFDLDVELARRLVEADIGRITAYTPRRRNRSPPAVRRPSA